MTTERFDELRTREDVRTLYIHEQAGLTITRMLERCELIKNTWGTGEEFTKAVTSLHHCLAALLRTGFSNEAYITKENDDIGLSLYVQEGEAFVFGIVWFRNRSYDNTPLSGISGEWSTHS